MAKTLGLGSKTLGLGENHERIWRGFRLTLVVRASEKLIGFRAMEFT